MIGTQGDGITVSRVAGVTLEVNDGLFDRVRCHGAVSVLERVRKRPGTAPAGMARIGNSVVAYRAIVEPVSSSRAAARDDETGSRQMERHDADPCVALFNSSPLVRCPVPEAGPQEPSKQHAVTDKEVTTRLCEKSPEQDSASPGLQALIWCRMEAPAHFPRVPAQSAAISGRPSRRDRKPGTGCQLMPERRNPGYHCSPAGRWSLPAGVTGARGAPLRARSAGLAARARGSGRVRVLLLLRLRPMWCIIRAGCGSPACYRQIELHQTTLLPKRRIWLEKYLQDYRPGRHAGPDRHAVAGHRQRLRHGQLQPAIRRQLRPGLWLWPAIRLRTRL